MEPSLCFSLRTGLKIAGIVDILIALGSLAASVGAIVYFEKYTDQVLNLLENPPPELAQFLSLSHLGPITLRIFLGFSVIYWIQKIWLGYLLHRAAVENSLNKSRYWMVHTFGLLCLSVAFFLATICVEVVEPMSIPIYIVLFIIREYSMWMVARFRKKLDESKSPLLVDAKEFTNL